MKRGYRRHRSGFSAIFNWPLLCAAAALGSLISAIWPGLNTWPSWMDWPPWADYLAAAVLGTAAIALYARIRRGPAWRARRELVLAAAGRTSGIWLNRDEHQVFGVISEWPRWFRFWYIGRIPEDSLREAIRESGGGEVPLLAEMFGVIPVTHRVLHRDMVLLIRPDTGEVRNLPRAGSRLRQLRRHHAAVRAGFGFIAAPAEAVAEVAAQLRGSERLSAEEEIA